LTCGDASSETVANPPPALKQAMGSTLSEADRVRIPALNHTVNIFPDSDDHRNRCIARYKPEMREVSFRVHKRKQIKDENITRTFREYDTLPVRQTTDLYKEGTALFRVGHKVLLKT
jgi:hypothetical protein